MFRQGELIFRKVLKVEGDKLNHLIIAEGEATNHKHEVTSGRAELYGENGTMYLRVNSERAKVTHPDHNTIVLPKGNYEVVVQREYVVGDEKYRNVVD